MRTRKRDRDTLLLVVSIAIIVGTAALYVWVLSGWLSGPDPAHELAQPAPASVPAPPPASAALEPARRAYREGFLDPRSWLALSDALARAGRPVDAFYVTHGAREFFGDERFFAAAADAARGAQPETAGLDEAELRDRLKSDPADAPAAAALSRLYAGSGRVAEAQRALDSALSLRPEDSRLLLAKARLTADPMASIPLLARAVHAEPRGPEAKQALDELRTLASGSEEGPRGETARLGREALEELRKAHPSEASIFGALALALLARGDRATVQALVVEAGRKSRNPAVAMAEGELALETRDTNLAIARFTEAWEADPDDLRSAERLAALYSDQRADDEAALPYQIALYRRDPRRMRGLEPIDQAIRRTLDSRRQTLLKNVKAEGLGRFLRAEDASLRAEACARAAQLKDPRWVDALAELLDDDTEIVRRNADYALYQLAKEAPEAVKVRSEDWLRDERPLVRARSLNLCADLWPRETMPAALRALDDRNAAVRYLAKTMVFDRYYQSIASAQRAQAQYVAHEKDRFALALLGRDRARPQARR